MCIVSACAGVCVHVCVPARAVVCEYAHSVWSCMCA